MAEIRELSVRDCEALLRSGVAGRVAISTATGPYIVPVNYAVLDRAIIVRTSPYSLLGTYGSEAVVAFEIDGFDRDRERGWSVQARGRVQAVTEAGELTRIREKAGPQPWAGGSRSLYLRLPWTELTGRKLGAHWDPALEVPAATDVTATGSDGAH